MNVWDDDFRQTAKYCAKDDDPKFIANIVLDYFVRDTDAKNKSVFDYYFHHVV